MKRAVDRTFKKEPIEHCRTLFEWDNLLSNNCRVGRHESDADHGLILRAIYIQDCAIRQREMSWNIN